MTLKTRGQLIRIQKLVDEAISIYNNISLEDHVEILYFCSTPAGLDLSMLLADTKNTVTDLIDNAKI